MTTGNRLKNLREQRGWKQPYVAEKIGVTAQSVSQWERGKTEPTLDNYMALARLFDTTVDQLKSEQGQQNRSVELIRPSPAGGAGRPADVVPEFDLRGGATYGGVYARDAFTMERHDDSGHGLANLRAEWGFPENWFAGEMRLSVPTTDVLAVDSPAMMPDLALGDRVIVDRSVRDPKLDAIFAIRDGETVIIKRVQLIRGTSPPRIICKSANPDYEPFELTLDGQEAAIIGRIVGRVSRL